MDSISSGAAAAVSFTPSGVNSNAQASTTANGKPRITSHSTKLIDQSGSGMAGKTTLAASSTTNDTVP